MTLVFFEIKIHELHRTMSDQLVWEELDIILLSFVGDYRAPISQVFQWSWSGKIHGEFDVSS